MWPKSCSLSSLTQKENDYRYLCKDDVAQYPYKHQNLAKNTTL